MERISRRRALVLLIVFGLILTFYAGKLFSLQLEQSRTNTTNANTFTSKTIVKGTRGDLLDRNGNVLVGNRASYNLVFNHYVIKSAEGRNDYLKALLERAEELELPHADHFPISESRPFEYTLEDYSNAWQTRFQEYLTNLNKDSDMTAPMLMEVLWKYYELPADWTQEEIGRASGRERV